MRGRTARVRLNFKLISLSVELRCPGPQLRRGDGIAYQIGQLKASFRLAAKIGSVLDHARAP
jgi:hypothetical protein